MLKKILRHIDVYFLIGIISISSMGFSVNTLYCYCLGAFQASLFDIEHQCTQLHSADASHCSAEHSCCKKLRTQQNPEETGCTKRTTQFVKADLTFTTFEHDPLPKWIFEVEMPLRLSTFFYNAFTIATVHGSFISIKPPPQLWGRLLLNFIQVYRI